MAKRGVLFIWIGLFLATSCFADSIRLNPMNLAAEQLAPTQVPKGSDPIHWLGRIFPGLGMTGSLPAEYTPAAAKTFSIPTILLPEDQVDLLTLEADDPRLLVVVEGQRYVRFFIHPLEVERYRAQMMLGPEDPVQWIGTPSSSSRSLFVTDKEQAIRPFVAKVSLSRVLAGIDRRMYFDKVQRGVTLSRYYNDLWKRTGGVIPHTNKTWTFFAESSGVGLKSGTREAMILRDLPTDYAEVGYLPFYGLLAPVPETKTRWIDALYAASGHSNKFDFAWNEIALPTIELIWKAQSEGITPELHQQNGLLRVSLETKKVLGVAVKDLDSQETNYLIRKNILGLPVQSDSLTREASLLFGYHRAQRDSLIGYEYFKDAVLKHVFRYFLNPRDLRRLVLVSNQRMLDRFNEAYADKIGVTEKFLGLGKAYKKLYAHFSSPEEKRFFADEAKLEMKSRGVARTLSRWVNRRYYRAKQRLEGVALWCSSLFSGARE